MFGDRCPHWLAVEAGIERQRPERRPVRSLVVLAEPRIAVAQAPRCDRHWPYDRKYDVEIFRGVAPDSEIALRLAAADLDVVDVHLGYHQSIAELDDATQKTCQLAVIQYLMRFKMRLQGEAVDGRIPIPQGLQQSE